MLIFDWITLPEVALVVEVAVVTLVVALEVNGVVELSLAVVVGNAVFVVELSLVVVVGNVVFVVDCGGGEGVTVEFR